tara:strand:- start:171 stop:521 length:351 start_codon:yes stop_codon:yes gene_type:complete
MSLKNFNPYAGMRIDRVKAHHTYLKPKKDKASNYDPDTEYAENNHTAPWELTHVKGLAAGKMRGKYSREKVFDTKNDGQPFKKKKETKKDKDSRAFLMMEGKKYHEIGAKCVGDRL